MEGIMGNGFGGDVWGTSRCELAEELSGGWGGEVLGLFRPSGGGDKHLRGLPVSRGGV